MSVDDVAAAWGAERTGPPTGPERSNPDGVGRRRDFLHGVVHHHEGRGVGGFVPFGVAWETFRAHGWERGRLGYPTNARPPASSGALFAGRSTTYPFEHGALRTGVGLVARPPLSVLWANTALIGIGYVHSPDARASLRRTRDRLERRRRHVDDLVRWILRTDVDVVCLGEVFKRRERRRIRDALGGRYPHDHEGPVKRGFRNDGGLMLLSRHPITVRGQSTFRARAMPDALAAKGVLHARIHVGGGGAGGWGPWGRFTSASYQVDLFATHLQAGPHPGVREQQARQLASWVEATNQRARPCVVVGDLNLDLHTDPWTTLGMLGRPRDAWAMLHRPGTPALAEAEREAAVASARFDRDGRPHPGWTSASGRRIDAVLLYPSYRTQLVPRTVDVPDVRATFRDAELSDHRPLIVRFGAPVDLEVELHERPSDVTARLVSVHAIDTTGVRAGRTDDLRLRLDRDGRRGEPVDVGRVRQGQLVALDDRRLSGAVRADGEVVVAARAWDVRGRRDRAVALGRGTARVPAEHALLMAHPASNRTPHALSVVRGRGARYVVRASVTA